VDNPSKLQSEDIAHMIKAVLEMNDRGFTPELSVFATNPVDLRNKKGRLLTRHPPGDLRVDVLRCTATLREFSTGCSQGARPPVVFECAAGHPVVSECAAGARFSFLTEPRP
jgi:hypothetical protein